MYDSFVKGLIYERMSHGGVFYTAKQIQEMAEGIAGFLDGHSVEDLKDVRSAYTYSLLAGEEEEVDGACALITGYLYACEQFIAVCSLEHTEEDIERECALADRFYRMAGL